MRSKKEVVLLKRRIRKIWLTYGDSLDSAYLYSETLIAIDEVFGVEKK